MAETFKHELAGNMNVNVDQPTSQFLLAMDTSGPQLQLALIGVGKIDVLNRDIARGHAEIIFDQIGLLLRRNDIDYRQLTRLAVTTGPGSFTGLRIGIAGARGLALALGIPIVGVQNLLALSLGGAPDEPVDVVIDARRDEAYAQLFSRPGIPSCEPQLITQQTAQSDYPRAGINLIDQPRVDISALAEFSLEADPSDYPAAPTYVRAADAKPQTKGKIALVEGSSV